MGARTGDRGPRIVGLVAGVLLGAPLVAAQAGQIESATFFGLRRGMSESEILVRAGPPDLITSPGTRSVVISSDRVSRAPDGGLAIDRVKRVVSPALERWHYIPDRSESDPHLTVITFRGGQVWDMERTKVFSRAGLPAPPGASGDAGQRLSDEEIRLRRAERTLEAAESYAETRERLRKAATSAPEDPGGTVYRGTDAEGAAYFGDRPPAEASPQGTQDD